MSCRVWESVCVSGEGEERGDDTENHRGGRKKGRAVKRDEREGGKTEVGRRGSDHLHSVHMLPGC